MLGPHDLVGETWRDRREHEPATEVTGELPVSLVDTARVLEVFVPVVSVGEHLAAPLTLVAVARYRRQARLVTHSDITTDGRNTTTSRTQKKGKGAEDCVRRDVNRPWDDMRSRETIVDRVRWRERINGVIRQYLN